ncbi:MAG: PIN domain-containing protein [Oscillospiraceae bacterium]|jgi:predicted nucleic acid-binding protein|nr:PIN domain-containing protein [Oscillospiraceae bacterium]
MILIDTSVLIDKLRKIETEKTLLLDRLHYTKTPYGISIFTYHEILQGAKSEIEFKKLYDYFSTQKIFSLPNTVETYTQSSKLCFTLRRQGLTVRNTIDILIAYTAIYFDIPLLHNDRDFDLIAERVSELKIFNR